jgi:predicted metalloprotease
MTETYRAGLEATSAPGEDPPLRRISCPWLAALVAGALLATGCATERTDDLSLGGAGGDPETIDPTTGLDDDGAPTSEEVVEAALADVEAFWDRTFDDVYGRPYEPIRGGFWPYGPTSDQPPCGSPPPRYEEVAGNAFYCPSADLIAWDAVALVPELYEEFGGFTLGIVFAHELGHAVQERAGVAGPTIMRELQADCFAGAWTADVEDGGAEHFEVGVEDLDRAVAGFLELRDEVGVVRADHPAAHGTGFDRIGAFVEGYEHGASRCAAYPDEFAAGDHVVVEVPFSQADLQTGGNLPLEDLGPLLLADLEDFWSQRFAEEGETWTPVADVVTFDPSVDEVECGDETFTGDLLVEASFYCAPSDTIFLDGSVLLPALVEIGDYAVATEIARQYAFAAQQRLGVSENTLETNLHADCLAGLYAFSGFAGDRGDDQQLFLSAGDLDEAVIGFLRNSDASADVDDRDDRSVGTAFQRFNAYRDGFLEGPDACEALLAGSG